MFPAFIGRHGNAIDAGRTLIGTQQIEQQPKKGGFARAVVSNEAKTFVGRDVQLLNVKHCNIVVFLL